MPTGDEEERPVVLVVEDERDLADLYADWLATEYTVDTAYDGREALDQLSPAIDVVLLDRRMPRLSGDDVLEEIRSRGLDCRIAMVTAVEPEFDIIDMGFDDYLVKPVSNDELLETVERLLVRSDYDQRLQAYFTLSSKRAVLEQEKDTAELEASEEYQAVLDELAAMREELDETLEELDETAFKAVFRDIDRSPMS